MLKIKKTTVEAHFEALDLNQFKDREVFPEKIADSRKAIRELKEKGKLKFPTK
ncbi:hypothetical protein [Runella rosea]|uniref:hypothetical protein n=1 Tax=Runella rosea TaxID=2259595 RepID=UPI0013B3B73B|nr:hypothetical protein [Runella rosea]